MSWLWHPAPFGSALQKSPRLKRTPFCVLPPKQCGRQPSTPPSTSHWLRHFAAQSSTQNSETKPTFAGNLETKEPWYTIHCYLIPTQILIQPPSSSSLDQHPDIQCHMIPSTRKTSLPLNSPAKIHHRRKTPSQKRPQAKSRYPRKICSSQGSWLSSLSAPPEVMNTRRAPLPAVCQICTPHR